ncbi:MAG TPA: DUF3347 domain-containing protein [Puia sp.]|jgi:hypothetical protein|nr:DUF3347 domain-containing protein [Puia sp.]
MKILILTILLFAPAGARKADLSPILTDYYQLKDALVAGDAAAAATAAGEMLKAVNGVDMASMAPADHTAFMSLQDKLAYDARHISESKDINHQREHFASLSANLFKLAKEVKLSPQPIYEDYCPMKKVYWLSGDSAIKNPYYGSSMPTCGKVAATIQPK